MPKTERLVVLLEPSMVNRLRAMARKTHSRLSCLVRQALDRYIHDQSAHARMKNMARLSRYHIRLGDLTDTRQLNKVIEENLHE